MPPRLPLGLIQVEDAEARHGVAKAREDDNKLVPVGLEEVRELVTRELATEELLTMGRTEGITGMVPAGVQW